MLDAVITYAMTPSGPNRPTNCTAITHRWHTRASGLLFLACDGRVLVREPGAAPLLDPCGLPRISEACEMSGLAVE
jgi:hypothetical protein